MLAKIKSVAFDLDNTLINRDAAALAVFARWFPDNVVPHTVLQHDHHGLSPRSIFFSWLTTTFPHLGSNLWQRFQHDIVHEITPNPSNLALLEDLDASGLNLAILTNGGDQFQRAKIKSAGLDTIFSATQILTSAAIGFEKPDPRSFQALSRKLGLHPSEILFVGDQPQIDIAGAKCAGFQTCHLTTTKTSSVNYFIDNLSDLRHILL